MQAQAGDSTSAVGLLWTCVFSEDRQHSHSFLHGGGRREESSSHVVPTKANRARCGDMSQAAWKGKLSLFCANKGSDQLQQPLASTEKHHPISLKAPWTLATSTQGAQVGSPELFDLSRLQSFAAYRNTLRNFSFILPFP